MFFYDECELLLLVDVGIGFDIETLASELDYSIFMDKKVGGAEARHHVDLDIGESVIGLLNILKFWNDFIGGVFQSV